MEQSLNVIWQQLPIDDILYLCETNPTYHQICQNPVNWVFLLKRDFGITYYGDEPRLKYMYEYTNHKYQQIKNKHLYIIVFPMENLPLDPVPTAILADNIEQVYQALANDYNTKQVKELIDAATEMLFDKYLEDKGKPIGFITPQEVEDIIAHGDDKIAIRQFYNYNEPATENEEKSGNFLII